jgi:hypothetical protein
MNRRVAVIRRASSFGLDSRGSHAAVKKQFDELNYGTLLDSKYEFNPYARFVHGAEYANFKNAYSYSVDDEVGNIQAEGTGFIIDVGGVSHLENQNLATPPVNINLGYDPLAAVKFMRYSVCNGTNWNDAKPYSPTFIISANDPQSCPVYLEDSKVPTQRYALTVMSDPAKTFPSIPVGAAWDATTTAAPIYCKGNLENPGDPSNPYRASSRQWRCTLTTGGRYGAFAFSMPDPNSGPHMLVS